MESRITVVVHGAGGYGSVVCEVAVASGHRVAGFVDDLLPIGQLVLELPGSGPLLVLPSNTLDPQLFQVALGIGDNRARRGVAERWAASGVRLASPCHPSAVVSPSALVLEGTVIMPLAVVNSGAKVGAGSVVNTGAIVEHHSIVGSFVHIAPGARLCGGVTIGDNSLIGAGAVILPGIKVGNNSVVGAGAVVRRDVPEAALVGGVPARSLR